LNSLIFSPFFSDPLLTFTRLFRLVLGISLWVNLAFGEGFGISGSPNRGLKFCLMWSVIFVWN
jgi:hypothetical protein